MNTFSSIDYIINFPSNSEEELLLDDFRFANYKNLIFSQFDKKITLFQDFNLNKGGIFWDGAYLLTKYFLRTYYKEFEYKKSVLELGGGTSLPTLVLASMGYKTITTDLKYLINFVKKNVEINFSDKELNINNKPEVEELEWGKKEDIDRIKEKNKFDYILCSELIYIEESFEDLVNTLESLCEKETKIIFSYRIRMKEKLEWFLEKLGKKFCWNVIDKVLYEDIHPNKGLFIMEATKI